MHCFRDSCLVTSLENGAEIAVLGLILVSQGTCLVAGFEKSAEIAVLRLIHVSQERIHIFP